MKKLVVGRSPTLNIRGVLAAEPIRKDEVIEISPVVIFPGHQRDAIEHTAIDGYCFEWDQDLALAFGHGSLFNHSYDANAEFDQDYENHTIVFVAVKDIQPGEEILINYNGAADDTTPVEWLESNR